MPTNLQKFEGQTGLLHFTDGHVVKARIVHVDSDDRKEVIYDIVEVVNLGQSRWSGVKPGTTATGSLSEVSNFEVLGNSKS